jgi:hypothetical protein
LIENLNTINNLKNEVDLNISNNNNNSNIDKINIQNIDELKYIPPGDEISYNIALLLH